MLRLSDHFLVAGIRSDYKMAGIEPAFLLLKITGYHVFANSKRSMPKKSATTPVE